MSNKNLRHLSLLVTSQTAYNLQRLAQMAGYREIGRVVDKLVREKMIALHFYREARKCGERAAETMRKLEMEFGKELNPYENE